MISFKNRIVIVFCFLIWSTASSQQTISSLDELIQYANLNSISLKSDQIRFTQAKKAKLAAILGVLDPTGSNTLTAIENTTLPVSVLPAELFGGEPGTFQQVQTGVPYTTTFNQEINVKLLNIKGWKDLKLAKINIDLTQTNNLLSLKSLHENIAENYYNIINLQEQLKSARVNTKIADSLLQISQQKFDSGQVRMQDLNNAKANYLTVKESQNQISYLITQYYLTLKILCDIPDQVTLSLNENISLQGPTAIPEVSINELAIRNALLNEAMAKTTYRQLKSESYPSLSFVFSNTSQQFNQDFTVFGGDWIPSRYFGLKASISIPSATLITNRAKAKFDYQIAQNNTQQSKIQAQLDAKLLENDFQMAVSDYNTNKELYALNLDTYNKNKRLYQSGLIALDQTLDSYNAMINANYQQIGSKITLLLNQAKIRINNTMQ